MSNLYFIASQGAAQRLIDLFDFVWPTAAAMWNLRSEVEGYIGTRPDATAPELKAKFAGVLGLVRVDLVRACIETPWESQQRRFAEMVLISSFAIYEGWLEDVPKSLGATNAQIEDFEFPPDGRHNIHAAVTRLTTPESTVTKPAFYKLLCSNRKNTLSSLDNLLVCYRYFKACRNDIIHNSGRARQKTVDAAAAYSLVATGGSFGVKEPPACTLYSEGDEVTIGLRAAVGMSDVVRRLIVTLDAELSRSQEAERELKRRWGRSLGKRKFTLKSDSVGRSAQVARYAQKIGLPKPTDTAGLERYFRAERLMTEAPRLAPATSPF
jgi:hypothetical protein